MRRRDPIVLITTGNSDVSPSATVAQTTAFAAAGRFHFAVRPLGDHQISVDRRSDAFQFALFFKSIDEMPK
jgi:hypothetical protein